MNKFVIAKGYYGLGGNLATLVCAMRLARKLNRGILVDWIDGCYGLSHADIFQVLFKSPEYILNRDALTTETVWPEFWKKYISRTMPQSSEHPLSRVTTEMVEESEPIAISESDVIVISRDDKYWYDSEYRFELSDIANEIIPRDAILREIDEFREETMGADAIGVHFRHGNGERSVVPPDISWFFARVDEYLRESPHSNIFLCTDCWAVISRFEDRYPQRVVSTSKEYPAVGSGAMHQVKGDSERSNSAREAVIDIWLLAKCKYLVGSRSFFTGFAIKLNKNLSGQYVKGWVPSHRQYTNPPGRHAIVDDCEFSALLASHQIGSDGLYMEDCGQSGYRLYYLYAELAQFASFSEIDYCHLKRRIEALRLY